MNPVLTVYVPHPEGYLGRTIAKGSGIVGVPAEGGAVLIYYEGNIYGAQNIRTYEDKIYHAADRLVAKYPTVARTWAKPEDLVRVGTYDHPARTFRPDPGAQTAIDAWTGPAA